jgi:hypothetical protein
VYDKARPQSVFVLSFVPNRIPYVTKWQKNLLLFANPFVQPGKAVAVRVCRIVLRVPAKQHIFDTQLFDIVLELFAGALTEFMP